MAEVKVSALTALTGANVANGDELYIVDTGSPNVSKKITADELAQMPQLSSRYAPKAGDAVWIPATDLQPLAGYGTPALGELQSVEVMLFDGSTREIVTFAWFPPNWWSTWDLYLWWSNAGAGAGAVVWESHYSTLQDGDTISVGVNELAPRIVPTSPAQNVLKVTKANASPLSVVPDELVTVWFGRTANDGSDTLGNDAALVGLQFVRAS